jgi:RNA polymerase sigma-70 factor (ECF subfamily)
MEESPVTRASLLVRIRDGQDTEAWRQFVGVYAELIYGYARRRGLQDADAADLMQEVLRSVAGAARRLEYDPRRGTFRSWLYTVTRNKLLNFLNSAQRRQRGGGGSDEQEKLEAQPAPGEDPAELWDQEYERRQLAWAAERVRGEFKESTWQAFWMTAVEGREPKEVAQALGMSVGAVYVAKSRAVARLKEEVRRLEGE